MARIQSQLFAHRMKPRKVCAVITFAILGVAFSLSSFSLLFATDPTNSSDASVELREWIDRHFDELGRDQNNTPEVCDDITFLRRVSLDLIGRIPSVGEIRHFEQNPSPEKRSEYVRYLLDSPTQSDRTRKQAAVQIARNWRRTMLPADAENSAVLSQFEDWLTERFEENLPFNDLVVQLLTARGEETRAIESYYLAIGATPEATATEISRVFLGVKIGCAQCHHHPFTDWKQQDFWGLAAYFDGVRYSQISFEDGMSVRTGGINDDSARGQVSYEGQTYKAKRLWADSVEIISNNQRPRDVLAQWLASPENPTFAANAANRIWQSYVGRGLVPAVDDFDLATEDEQAFAKELGQKFAQNHFNTKVLIQAICSSQPYQYVSRHQLEENPDRDLTIRPLKSMSPEQMYDSLEQVLMLPISASNEQSSRYNGEMQQLVDRLDERVSRSPEEYASGISQTLMLMNGTILAKATDLRRSHTLRSLVQSPFLTDAERVETLFLAALTRRPNDDEFKRLLTYIEGQHDETQRGTAYGNLLWALVNSPEFTLCR